MTTATLERSAATLECTPQIASQRLSKHQGTKTTQDRELLAHRARKAAVRFLENRGLDLLERDWSCNLGCIDVICYDHDNEGIVFVEVQIGNDSFPAESLTAEKREWLENIALAYLAECQYCDTPVRFDTVSIVPIGTDRAFVRHHVNALAVG